VTNSTTLVASSLQTISSSVTLTFGKNYGLPGNSTGLGSVITGLSSPGNTYTYICTVAGQSGTTEPSWPTTTGTVTDGTVTWAWGATIATETSRAINMSSGTGHTWGTGLWASGNFYNACVDTSWATLVSKHSSTPAAIRLGANQQIDFSGNQTLAGQNVRTLLYNSTSGNLEYQKSGSAVFSIADNGRVGSNQAPGVGVAFAIGGTFSVGLDLSSGAYTNAIRITGGDTFAWEGTSTVTTGWVTSKITDAYSGSAIRTLDSSGNEILTGSITAPAYKTSSGNFNVVGPSGTLFTIIDPASAITNCFKLFFTPGNNTWELAPTTAGTNLILSTAGGTLTVSAPVTVVTSLGVVTNTITSGAGAPSSTQPNGSLYLRTDGGASTRLYVSEGGGTWSAIASS
jgi:hypothetical protein